MAYPGKYTRQYDYVSYQNANPSRPLPADRVAADLNAVALSLQETIDFLKTSLRSDGAIMNGAIGADQLDPGLLVAGLAPASTWAAATAYEVGSNVVTGGALYRCLVAHTSGVFSTDLAAGRWEFVLDLPAGPAGTDGVDGADGTDGVDGTNGTDGVDGIGYGGTSTTSRTIGTGTKVFTTQAGLAYNGARVRATSGSNWMEGPATYSGTTLTIQVDLTGGSGTLADWVFAVAGEPGASGAGSGDVTGPASATASNIAVFNGTTGKIIQDGGKALPSGTVVGTSDSQSLTNKTLDNTNIATVKDTNFTLQDEADATKQAQFQLSGITTGTLRTYTLPDASTTMVGTDATQTLTNKTLNASNNTVSNLSTAMFASGVVDTDGTLAANSDTKFASQKAVKTYVDANIGGFASGTLMLFQQTSAPTGWTKQTTHNDKALRVVSGTASSGGTNAFSTVMAQTTVGSTTISTSTMPSHQHSVPYQGLLGADLSGSSVNVVTANSSGNTGSAGSGGSHNHSITMAIQYVDIIIASKN